MLQQSASNTEPTDNDFNFGTVIQTDQAFIPKVLVQQIKQKLPGIAETERERPVGVTVTTCKPTGSFNYRYKY